MTELPVSGSPEGDYVGAFAPRVAVEPMASALVVVDLQRGLASRTEGLGRWLALEGLAGAADHRFTRIEDVVLPNTARLLDAFRAGGLRRAFLVTGSAQPDYSDLPPHLRGICRAANARVGERELEVVEDVAPRPGEPVFRKLGLSAFGSTPLEATARAWGTSTLVFCGITTNMCVEHNVRDAADRGFGCVLVDDACATDSERMHDASLQTVGRLYGRVASTAEVLAELGIEVARA